MKHIKTSFLIMFLFFICLNCEFAKAIDCPLIVTSDITLTEDLDCSGSSGDTAVYINTDNVTFDGAGFKIISQVGAKHVIHVEGENGDLTTGVRLKMLTPTTLVLKDPSI